MNDYNEKINNTYMYLKTFAEVVGSKYHTNEDNFIIGLMASAVCEVIGKSMANVDKCISLQGEGGLNRGHVLKSIKKALMEVSKTIEKHLQKKGNIH